MADKQSPKNKAKRLVKNPETFRERAIKASKDGDKPKAGARAGRIGSAVTAPAKGPFKRVGRLKFIRFIGRIIFPPYIRNSWQELRKVTWPTWKQSRQLTGAVLIFAVVFGALIAVVDYGLDKVFRDILLK